MANSHIFVPVAIVSRDLESPSSGISTGVRPTNDSRHWRHCREATDLFQQLSVALQRGNAVSFHSTFTTDTTVVSCLVFNILPVGIEY